LIWEKDQPHGVWKQPRPEAAVKNIRQCAKAWPIDLAEVKKTKVVKLIRMWAFEDKHKKKSWQIQVPAAAVIPEWLALFSMIGRKGYVDGVSKRFNQFIKDGKF